VVKTKKLQVGDVCRVCVDWADKAEVLAHPVKIVGTQMSGELFYKVDWGGKSADLAAKYGDLFTSKELKRV
jgi:hypothetical protein